MLLVLKCSYSSCHRCCIIRDIQRCRGRNLLLICRWRHYFCCLSHNLLLSWWLLKWCSRVKFLLFFTIITNIVVGTNFNWSRSICYVFYNIFIYYSWFCCCCWSCLNRILNRRITICFSRFCFRNSCYWLCSGRYCFLLIFL